MNPTHVAAVNKVPERNRFNGLSQLQHAILAVLPDANTQPIAPGEILKRLHAPANPSTRASLSRSLRRLRERGLVDSYTAWFRVGGGQLYRRTA